MLLLLTRSCPVELLKIENRSCLRCRAPSEMECLRETMACFPRHAANAQNCDFFHSLNHRLLSTGKGPTIHLGLNREGTGLLKTAQLSVAWPLIARAAFCLLITIVTVT